MNVTFYDNLAQNIGYLTGAAVKAVRISWPTFTDTDGNTHYEDQLTVPVTDGGICTFVLPSNNGAGVSYTFTFDVLPNGSTKHVFYSAHVDLPPSTGIVSLANCVLSGAKWLVQIASLPAVVDTTLFGTRLVPAFIVADGAVYSANPTLTIATAQVGKPVWVAPNPSLPPGVQVIGKVSAPDTVALEFWNISGQSVSIPDTTLSVTVKG